MRSNFMAIGLTGMHILLAGMGAASVRANAVALNARDLYQGFEARKVVLSRDAASLGLDARVFDVGKSREGVITTDPIDLGPARDGIRLPSRINRVTVDTQAHVPPDTSVSVEVRTGNHILDMADWSSWKKLDGLKETRADVSGRYLQARLTLSSTNRESLPAVTRLVLTPDRDDAIVAADTIRVAEADIRTIVRSPIVFRYERPDHPRLVRFRQENNLDQVVAGATNDFEALVRLMDWTAACNNIRKTGRERHADGYYAWDLDHLFSRDGDRPNIYGHCMSYAAVMTTAATAMGYVGARHYAVHGFRSMGHEVTEVWAPDMEKWVYLDPSLSNYYYDKESRNPLDILEIHAIVASLFVPDGKDMRWWTRRTNKEAQNRVRKIGGKNDKIGCRLGRWIYGAPMPKNYDWGWRHGYLALGFIQMTPRNDFHSNPDAVSKKFGSYAGYDGFPFWADPKTPPTKGGHNWHTRRRDFYWTLDQASLNLVQNADGTSLTVELGHSMPFFKAYRLTIDGKTATVTEATHVWPLKKGLNKLEVAPVDERDKAGQGSSVTVDYRP